MSNVFSLHAFEGTSKFLRAFVQNTLDRNTISSVAWNESYLESGLVTANLLSSNQWDKLCVSRRKGRITLQ